MEKVIITGAAGNLGSLLAHAMVYDKSANLKLFWHRNPVDATLTTLTNVQTFQVDLSDPTTFANQIEKGDTIVHFAGVLFKANPEEFLPTTNTTYFKNLLEAAIKAKAKRIILISFPHVEGETTPQHPATGRLDGHPISMHAITRLEEEQLLLAHVTRIEAVSLRVGMVYGKGILMIEAARWFSRYHLLGVWHKPTWIHLISSIDLTNALKNAIYLPNIKGIYHIGDEGVQTLQEFLDDATQAWKTTHPWRMPLWMIYTAANCFEWFSHLTGRRSPLTSDFITIGRVSYYGDTRRMRQELLPNLTYKSYKEGLETLL